MTRIPLEDLDRMRTEEIQDKAASGILILLLKWFKLSRECTLGFFPTESADLI